MDIQLKDKHFRWLAIFGILAGMVLPFALLIALDMFAANLSEHTKGDLVTSLGCFGFGFLLCLLCVLWPNRKD